MSSQCKQDILDCLVQLGFTVDGGNVRVPGNKIQIDEMLVIGLAAAIPTLLGLQAFGIGLLAAGAVGYSQINDQLFYGPDAPDQPNFSDIQEIQSVIDDFVSLRERIGLRSVVKRAFSFFASF